jgi:hypothetical protein
LPLLDRIENRERISNSAFSSILVKRVECVGYCYSDTFIMATLSNKEAEQQQQQAKNGYWQNELHSLGIEPKQKKKFLIKKNLKN